MSRNSNEYVNVSGPVPDENVNMTGHTTEGINEPAAGSPEYELVNLRREGQNQARQIAELQNMINQLTSQLMATPNEKPIKKPKMATPDKYDGNREGLRTFLTTIELYCGYNDVPNDEEKILMANTHLKGKAASWMQPYVEDFLKDIDNKGTKDETRTLFSSWTNFKEEMGRIFGEVDAESQAEKAISRLKQTKAVSAYTAEFKQLQARINWDDSALRTVYEAGLKENIKDELVHYEKPKDLYSLIELATRIDTRLWERKEAQKGYRPGPPFANTRRHRSNKDHDGDTYMTGKVQDKSKDRNKARGKFNDGLSKEERQKRYDSKACLRCGEVGHFRRDCPKNEVKQGAVKIGMIRMPTPYPIEEQDETLSDLDLYDETRQATDEAFELVQEAIGLQDFKWDEPLPTDWQVEGAEVLRRLRNQQCWICGNTKHQANDCDIEGRVTITGPRAEEIACKAAQEQPRFKEPDDEETPRTFKERMERHERLRWVDCPKQCEYHLKDREETRSNEGDRCHINLWHNECRVLHCQMHQPEEKEAHEELCWINCTTNCQFHQKQRRNARKVDDYYHSTISAAECNAKHCKMPRASKPRVTTTRMLKQVPDKPNKDKSHERLLWTHCRKGCAFHRQQFEDARGVNDHLHSTLSANICEADGCPIHRTKKPSPKRKVAKEDIPHQNTHWSFCYDDQCTIHYSAKAGEGYFPTQGKSSPKTTLKEVRELGAQDLRLQATVLIDGHEVTALIDSGAARTVISPRVVEKNNIPYRTKKVPMRVVLADDSPTIYGNGWIRLETEAISLRLAGQESRERVSIMDLGETEMIIGYDWLLKHNPAIDWQKKTLLSREPVHKVAGARRKEMRPIIQSSTQDGRIGQISPHKIARIYAKDPRKVGVIWIRQVATTKEGPVPQVAPTKDEPLLAIPTEYRTPEFKELFEENEATDLAEHQDWDHEIILEEGAKLSPGGMYPIAPEHDAELRDYLRKNLKKGFIRPGSGPMASPILFEVEQRYSEKPISLTTHYNGVPTTFDGAENLQLLHTEIPTYNKNQTIVGNPYWLSRSWKNKQTSSIVIAFKSEEEAKKIESTLQLAIELKVDIIAIQEPWIAPSSSNNYEAPRSIAHQSFYQIFPKVDPNLRPRALFYISRSLTAEVSQREEIGDHDAIAITIQEGRLKFNIYNVYNQKNAENIKTFQRLLANTQLPISTLLLIDANEHHPWWDPGCKTSQDGQLLADWIEDQDLSLLNTPGTATFFRPHLSRETTLDLTIATPDLAAKVRDWQTTTETGSDHYGILFSIQTTKDLVNSPTNQTRYNTKRADWDLFREELGKAIQSNAALQSLDQIHQPRKADSRNLLLGQDNKLKLQLDAIGEAITLVIQQAADKAIPQLKEGLKAKPWWNQELTKLRRNVSHCQRIFAQQLQATSIEEAYLFKRDFLLARTTYQTAIKRAKREHWSNFLEKEDPQSIFKAMDYTKEKRVERIPPIQGETLETSFKGKCKAFRKALFPPPPSTALPSFNNHQEKEWEWPALSTTELERACSNKVKSSSPGPDALSQDIITAAYQAQPNTFFKAYSLLFNYGYHPTCWRRATGAILKKPSKPDYSTPKAYRVITLLSCLGKVTERIIAKRLGYLAETTNLLHDSQIGGRLKKSAIDAALLLVDQIQHQKQQGYTTSTVFLDVKGAFDHVSHNQFLDTLKRLGLPISLITWAKTFLSNRSLRLAFDGQIEEFSEINAGIPQGSPVSPIFFLIYIRDLFPQIDGFQLSYIDDISITTSSTSIKKNVKILQREVNKLVTKGKQLAIEFDIAKTELIHYTKNKRRKEIPLELPSKEKIYHKDTIKWLGVYLDNKLSFREHVAIRASQAKTAFNRLGRLANIDRGLSPFAIRQLYLACVTSIADYGSPIYWRNQSFIKDQLQPLHNAACRKVLGVFKTAPAIPTSIEASLPSPAVRLSQTNRKYALRAIQLAPTHPITKAIARLQKTTLQQSKQPNKPRQLRAITSSIPSTKEIEEIISYRFRPWDSLNYNISISKKSKEEEAAAHKDYIQTIEDNSIVIYSDASKTKDRDGIGVGLAVYNPNQEEIYAETKNIGEQQLVYNGELEGVTAAFEYAAKTAQKDQNIHVYADNQAAIYRLQSLSDKPGQQWVIRCQKAAKAILNRKAKIFLKWAPGHTDIEGNERADALAKEATKQTPKKSQTSLAFLGTKIKLLQRASQAEEWRKYREKVREKKTSYGAIFDLKLKNQLAIPRGTKRDILSSFYSLKIGHGYFNSYLKRVKRRECDLCRCGKPQTAEHLLRYCGFYSVERNQLKKTLNQKILKLPRLLHTTSGIEATLAFITSTRIGTRKWHLGQEG
ncbi:hypothetical protein BM1_07370 [Bipolaris maydis]|nr:hypothetical protein BM1_07370 [Bipolaris maydis]